MYILHTCHVRLTTGHLLRTQASALLSYFNFGLSTLHSGSLGSETYLSLTGKTVLASILASCYVFLLSFFNFLFRLLYYIENVLSNQTKAV